MKKIIRLTESDLVHVIKRVISEEKGESLEIEARLILSRLGYNYSLLKDYTRMELARALRRENKDRFSTHDEWEKLADKLHK